MERLLELGGVRASSRFVELDGRPLHFLDAGTGPPVVLLHGASGGCANWYRLLAPLAAEYRVLAPDLPGFGFSQAVQPSAPLGGHVAAVLRQWLGTVGVERCVVAGTSFGGLAAVRWAQQEPRQVSALALIDSVGLGRALPWVLRLASLRALSSLAVRPSRRGIRWQLHHLLLANAARLGETQMAALSEYLWQSAAATDLTRLAHAFSLFSTLRGQREVLTDDELRGLSMRTLILWGEHDRFLPIEHGRRAAALVPNAQLRIIPAAGHSPNWEAPAAVLECFSRFLRDES